MGDREAGRRTLPLVSEPWARFSVAATVLPWSVALTRVWDLDGLATIIFVVLGVGVVARFLLCRSIPEDKTSYKIYNVRPSSLRITLVLKSSRLYRFGSRLRTCS